MLEGTLTTIRGFRIRLRGWTRAMSCRSMVWATSKLAMTPSLRGRTTSMLPGVRPSMALAAWPTAITDRCVRSSATMEGSDSTIPWPRTWELPGCPARAPPGHDQACGLPSVPRCRVPPRPPARRDQRVASEGRRSSAGTRPAWGLPTSARYREAVTAPPGRDRHGASRPRRDPEGRHGSAGAPRACIGGLGGPVRGPPSSDDHPEHRHRRAAVRRLEHHTDPLPDPDTVQVAVDEVRHHADALLEGDVG